MLSLIIAGSRTVDPSIEDVDAAIGRLLEKHYPNAFAVLKSMQADSGEVDWPTVILEVVDGGADGGDNAGGRWAACRSVTVHPEPITGQDIAVHGKYKGPRMRNRRMAERGDCLIAFWDGVSGGTADMVCRMTARGKPALVVPTKSTLKPKRTVARKGMLKRTEDPDDRAPVTQ